MVRWLSIGTLVFAAVLGCVAQDGAASQSSGNAESQGAGVVEAAIEQFRTATRDRGLRSDSPRQFQAGGGTLPRYHGRLTYNIRNDIFDAIPHQIRQRGGEESILRRHQYGFNVSGPVYFPRLYNGGSRTFFTLSYEGVRESIARSLLETLPIIPERNGDFSQTVDQSGNPLPIYDPGATSLNPNYDPSREVSLENLQYLRTPFANNIIPRHRIDPAAAKVATFFPDPNANVGPFFRNNYFVVSPERNVVDGFTGRVDHIISDRHRVSVNLNTTQAFAGAARWIDNAANPGAADRNDSARSGSAQHIFTISPETINTFSVSASSSGFENLVDDGTNYPALLGIPGTAGTVFPVLNVVDDYLDLGRATLIRRNKSHTYSIANTYSTRIRKHNLRFGAQADIYQVNTYQPDYPSGRYRFERLFTSLPGIVNTGHGFATFMLGQANLAEMSIVEQPSYWRRSHQVARIVDQLEVRKGLNLTVNLAFERNSPRYEKFNRLSSVDLTAINPLTGAKGAMAFAKQDGRGASFGKPTYVVEPSINIAWNPTSESSSVVRLGFSRSYSGRPLQYGHWGSQGFNLYPTVVSQNRLTTPAMLLHEGFPASAIPTDQFSPSVADNTRAELQESSDDVPTYQHLGISYEREIPGNLLLVVSAARDSGKNLLVGEAVFNPNGVLLDYLVYRDLLNEESFLRNLRPYPQYQDFALNGMWPAGRYNRDAASIRLEKRATGGLTIRAAYTFSKQMDNYSGPTAVQDKYNLDKEWAVTSYNSPHAASLNYVYELPMGPNKALLAYSDWRRYLVAGWSISGTSTMVSGHPLSIRTSFNNTGTVVQALYPNLVPGVSPRLDNPSPELWFNPAAFSHPENFTIGNAPRNMPNLFGPPSKNHDVSVSKRVPLTSGQSLEFTAVGLNFTNIGNLDNPDTVIGTAEAPNANAGKILQSVGGRIIQLGLRLNF
jgi:hypothetical protein